MKNTLDESEPPRHTGLASAFAAPSQLATASARDNARARLFGFAANRPRVGRYRLIRRVAVGGQAEVFLARDAVLARDLIVKLRTPDVGVDAQADEARALARVVHPNVVTIFDVGIHYDAGVGRRRVYIATEAIVGQSLAIWRRQDRSWSERLAVALALCSGLACAHAAGVVHGDISPENVLVGDDGVAKLVDFGLAGVLEAGVAEAEDRRWVPVYPAPELPMGARSMLGDQYALCMTLRELFTDARSPTARTRRRLHAVIARGIRPLASSRFESIDALRLALARSASRPRSLGIAAASLVAAASTGFIRGGPRELTCDPVAAPEFSAISARFRAVDPGRGSERASHVVAELATWHRAWSRERDEACATGRAAERDCLERARVAFDAFRVALVGASEAAVRHAPGALASLPEIGTCVRPDRRIDARPELAIAAAHLAEAHAWLELHDVERVIAPLRAAIESIPDDALALRADIAFMQARLANWELRWDAAREHAQHASALALAADDPEQAASVQTWLALMSMNRGHDLDAADLWLRHARATATRGGLASQMRIIDRAEGWIAAAHGEHERALALQSGALMAALAADATNWEIEHHRYALAASFTSLGRHAAARVLYEQLATDAERRSAGNDPMLTTIYSSLGHSLDDVGEYDAARHAFARAREFATRNGATEVTRVGIELDLGINARLRGADDEARHILGEALERVPPRASLMRADILLNLAAVTADSVTAAELLDRAHAIFGASDDVRGLRGVRRFSARLALRVGRAGEAISILEPLIAELRIDGAEDDLAHALVDLADARWARDHRGDRVAAHAAIDEAIAALTRAGLPGPEAERWRTTHPSPNARDDR